MPVPINVVNLKFSIVVLIVRPNKHIDHKCTDLEKKV